MSSVPQTKLCSKCKMAKPLSEYHSAGNGSLRGDCKDCHRAIARHHQQQTYQPHARETKSDEERASRAKAALRRADLTYKSTHPDRVRAAARAWYAHNTSHAKKLGQQWLDKNRSKKAEYDQRRAARKAAAEGDFTSNQWIQLCQEYGHRCLCCGKQTKLTVDHIVPLLKGGSNDISNLQPLCKPCNSRKGDKVIDYRP